LYGGRDATGADRASGRVVGVAARLSHGGAVQNGRATTAGGPAPGCILQTILQTNCPIRHDTGRNDKPNYLYKTISEIFTPRTRNGVIPILSPSVLYSAVFGVSNIPYGAYAPVEMYATESEDWFR
jgi:hypothetical protein